MEFQRILSGKNKVQILHLGFRMQSHSACNRTEVHKDPQIRRIFHVSKRDVRLRLLQLALWMAIWLSNIIETISTIIDQTQQRTSSRQPWATFVTKSDPTQIGRRNNFLKIFQHKQWSLKQTRRANLISPRSSRTILHHICFNYIGLSVCETVPTSLSVFLCAVFQW